MNCRVCGSPIIKFFSLGKIPLVNSFLKKEDIINEKKYALEVGFCPKCYLVQLLKNVSPDKLFKNYIYFSSNSKLFLKYCKRTAKSLTKKLGLNSQSLVLEIASNDGALLQYFKKMNIQILGVDPAKNIAKVANDRGIKTIPEFFSYDFAKKIKKEQKVQADLIYGANVLAHVPEIVDFVKGVKVVLKPRGTAVFEFPYLKGLMENKFDIIYHEHVFYYSMIALCYLFKKAGLEIYDVEKTSLQGGSLRILVSHLNNFSVNKRVKSLINQELRYNFDKIETYNKISQNVNKLKENLLYLLRDLKSKGKKVAAYGAPAKGNVLLNYFGIDKNYLEFIVDKSKEKQGLYAPGTHLFVFPPEKIYKEKPDYLLVLCWNIIDEIKDQLKDYNGKFIIPIPKIRII